MVQRALPKQCKTVQAAFASPKNRDLNTPPRLPDTSDLLKNKRTGPERLQICNHHLYTDLVLFGCLFGCSGWLIRHWDRLEWLEDRQTSKKKKKNHFCGTPNMEPRSCKEGNTRFSGMNRKGLPITFQGLQGLEDRSKRQLSIVWRCLSSGMNRILNILWH